MVLSKECEHVPRDDSWSSVEVYEGLSPGLGQAFLTITIQSICRQASAFTREGMQAQVK